VLHLRLHSRRSPGPVHSTATGPDPQESASAMIPGP
jgi:hypothetical protein